MPIAETIHQVSRKQTTTMDYKQTDDGEYTQLDIVELPQNIKTVHNTEIRTVYQQDTRKSSACSKTRLLLVACLLITIIAVISVTVLAVLYVKETDDKKDTPTTVGLLLTPSTTPDRKGLIALDISSLHTTKFASSNRTMMSNIYFDGAIAGPGKRQLTKYYGILGDRNILKGDQLDFRFKVEYKIIKEATSNLLVFDLAMCSLCNIDRHWYGGFLDIDCWDMHVSLFNKTNNVKLSFEYKGKYVSNDYFVSSTNVGTTKIVSYDIHVSGRTNTISYNELSGKHLNTFNNVNFTDPLFILFGLYNPSYFQSVFQFVET